LPPFCGIEGIDDSKKLTSDLRQQLSDLIKKEAVSYSLASISVDDIDRINILQATLKGMINALDGLQKKADVILPDGRDFPFDGQVGEAIIKGDQLSMSIAAASILAKVARDDLMLKYDKEYPQYGFSRHKGYGTPEHRQAIISYGITPIHRRSFLKNLQNENPHLHLLE